MGFCFPIHKILPEDIAHVGASFERTMEVAYNIILNIYINHADCGADCGLEDADCGLEDVCLWR